MDDRYFDIGAALGLLVGTAAFVVSYVYCISNYGPLVGVGLGWLPSFLLAWIVGIATCRLWGPLLVAVMISSVAILGADIAHWLW